MSAPTPTLSTYAQQELPSIMRLVSKSTAGAYESAFRLRVEPTLGEHKLNELSARAIEDAYYQWAGTISTKQDALAILSRLVKRAVRDGYMSHNPVRDIEKPRVREMDPIPKALTSQQVTALFDNVPSHYQFFFGLMTFAGLRFGEAAGILPGDIDLNHGLVTFSRQLDRRGELSPTKSGRSRTAPIIPELKALVPANLTQLGEETLVNRAPSGARIHSSNLCRDIRWREIRDSIRPGLRYHDLRHHAATNFLAKGLPVNAVQAFLGHSNISVTSRYVVTGRAEA